MRRFGELKHRLDHPTDAPGLSPDHIALIAAMRQLPSSQREALALHYLAGLSVAQTAAALHIPTGTVKARLSRGRTALATLLDDSEVGHV